MNSAAEALAGMQAARLDGRAWPMPEGWNQGRTAYGGFSAMLAYDAAASVADDLPPLQSAQVSFVGPASGNLSTQARILRRGRNSAFVQADLLADGQIVLTGTFIFMNWRPSHVDQYPEAPTGIPPVPGEDEIRIGSSRFFTQRMEFHKDKKHSQPGSHATQGWIRLADRDRLDPMAELICLGDAMPPGAIGLVVDPTNISSMNWQVNVLTERPDTENGWFYLRSEAHFTRQGLSSQFMHVWNSRLELVATGMQAMAFFG